ncbi:MULTISPECIES: hypothetical protein [unclassified Saccharibacter]|uniref:hypothetical protein n=1 Tax=unclassified Saccharibacter TaxID=2648722 RepID=UPI00132A857E|nr:MULTISPECIES: hypothetical protein [unclassified Saccharibacter]MXV36822.1 hypothetical protein [Saccharibacter sp. EH611]
MGDILSGASENNAGIRTIGAEGSSLSRSTNMPVGASQALSLQNIGLDFIPKLEKLVSVAEVNDEEKQAVIKLGARPKHLDGKHNFEAVLDLLRNLSNLPTIAQNQPHKPNEPPPSLEKYLQSIGLSSDIEDINPTNIALVAAEAQRLGQPKINSLIKTARRDSKKFDVPVEDLDDARNARIASVRLETVNLIEGVKRTHTAQKIFATSLNDAINALSMVQRKIDQKTNSLWGVGGEATMVGTTVGTTIGAMATQKIASSAMKKATPSIVRGATRLGLTGLAEGVLADGVLEGGAAALAGGLAATPVGWIALGGAGIALGSYAAYKYFSHPSDDDKPEDTKTPSPIQQNSSPTVPTVTGAHPAPTQMQNPPPTAPPAAMGVPSSPPQAKTIHPAAWSPAPFPHSSSNGPTSIGAPPTSATMQTVIGMNAQPIESIILSVVPAQSGGASSILREKEPSPPPAASLPSSAPSLPFQLDSLSSAISPASLTTTHNQNVDVNVNVLTGQDVSVALQQSRIV